MPAVVAAIVIAPDLYSRPDSFQVLADAQLQGVPNATERSLFVGGPLGLAATEVSLANGGFAVSYLQGFFFVQVIGADPDCSSTSRMLWRPPILDVNLEARTIKAVLTESNGGCRHLSQ